MIQETAQKDSVDGVIDGPSLPAVGSKVPMTRWLHDNGFGACAVTVEGLYGQSDKMHFCNFVAYPRSAWTPTDLPPRSLRWLEKRIATWDAVWPDARWSVSLAWPWQSEEWVRERPGRWVVSKTGRGLV